LGEVDEGADEEKRREEKRREEKRREEKRREEKRRLNAEVTEGPQRERRVGRDR
jgi:hypothetical protein